LPPYQLAVATLRNEIIGLADSCDKRLKEADSALVLGHHSFGFENKKRTYNAYFAWFNRTNSRLKETVAAVQVVVYNFMQYQKSNADLVGARRIRNQFEETFQNLLAVYTEVRKAEPPNLFMKPHEIYKNGVHSMIIDYVSFLRDLEGALENSATGGPKRSLNFNMSLKIEGFNEALKEARRKLFWKL